MTVGTVTAQLLYEIGSPRYLSPDAVARFDTIELPRRGPTGCGSRACAGEAPPPTLKVTANLDAGWRNAMTLAMTGAQVDEKARLAADAVWAGIPGGREAFAETAEDLSGDLTGGGMAYLRLAVRGDDEQRRRPGLLGRRGRDQPLELPGHVLHLGAVGGAGRGPLLADHRRRSRRDAAHRVRRGGGPPHRRPASPRAPSPRAPAPGPERRRPGWAAPARRTADLVRVPLWVLVGARSGDKGGDANVGVWADEDDVAEWLQREFTVDDGQGAAAGGRSRSRSAGTRCRTCGRSTSSSTGSSVGAWPRTCASTPRPRAWVSCCARASSRCRPRSCRAGDRRRGSPRPDARTAVGPAAAARASGRMARWSVAAWSALVAGIAIVVLTVWSVFTALVVPRVTSSRLMRTLALAR